MKKYLLFFFLTLLPEVMVNADDSGSCGNNITWTYLEATKTLTFSGIGEIPGQRPWFKYNDFITKVIIEEGITSIGDGAFGNCKTCSSIKIPNSVTNIGKRAFANCSSLTSIIIPKGVSAIGEKAFEGCDALVSVTFHCREIGSWFDGCKSLKELIFGEEVTSIGVNSFRGCSGLTAITIPNSVTTIGWGAFEDCTSLTFISIPTSVISIGGSAFEKTPWYNNKPDGLLYVGKVAYKYKGTMPNNTNIDIANGTIEIASYAFQNCRGLTSVTIPNSVTTIGSYAFYGCTSLTSLTLPNSVTTIEGGAFASSGLISIAIGSGVTSIGGQAFECEYLTSIYLSDLISWCMVTFPDWTMYNSNPFEKGNISHIYLNGEEIIDLVIPDGVTKLNNRAFYNLKSLTSITIPNSIQNIGSCALEGCDNIMDVYSYITEPFNSDGVFSAETLRKGTLHIPAGTRDLYTRFDGWRNFLKIVEMPTNEDPIYLTLKDASAGKMKILVKKGENYVLKIEPESGWKLSSLTYNDNDVTSQIDNKGHFTTPAISTDAVVCVVYEQQNTRVTSMDNNNIKVKPVMGGVRIENVENDSICQVFTTEGKLRKTFTIKESSAFISLTEGQIYIIKIGEKTLKVSC